MATQKTKETYVPDCLLLITPGEILNNIHRLTLVEPKVEFTKMSDPHKKTALLRTCSQIRNEASSIFSAENRFTIPQPAYGGEQTNILVKYAGKQHMSTMPYLTIRFLPASIAQEVVEEEQRHIEIGMTLHAASAHLSRPVTPRTWSEIHVLRHEAVKLGCMLSESGIRLELINLVEGAKAPDRIGESERYAMALGIWSLVTQHTQFNVVLDDIRENQGYGHQFEEVLEDAEETQQS